MSFDRDPIGAGREYEPRFNAPSSEEIQKRKIEVAVRDRLFDMSLFASEGNYHLAVEQFLLFENPELQTNKDFKNMFVNRKTGEVRVLEEIDFSENENFFDENENPYIYASEIVVSAFHKFCEKITKYIESAPENRKKIYRSLMEFFEVEDTYLNLTNPSPSNQPLVQGVRKQIGKRSGAISEKKRLMAESTKSHYAFSLGALHDVEKQIVEEFQKTGSYGTPSERAYTELAHWVPVAFYNWAKSMENELKESPESKEAIERTYHSAKMMKDVCLRLKEPKYRENVPALVEDIREHILPYDKLVDVVDGPGPLKDAFEGN